MTISLEITGTFDSCEKLIATLRTAKRVQKQVTATASVYRS